MTATRRYLPFDEMLTMRLPPEASPRETWRLLQGILRLGGIDETVPDYEGSEYWYYLTQEIGELIADLTCACRSGSPIDQQLATAQNRSVLVRARLDEAVAAAQLDGLDLAAEDAYEMLLRGRTPRDDTERVLMNSFNALQEVEAMVDEPFTPELFYRLRRMLLEGVEPGAWRHTEPHHGTLPPADYDDDVVRDHGARQIELICRYANSTDEDISEHRAASGTSGLDARRRPPHGSRAVLRALLLADMVRFYRPLPDMNGQVGRLAFKLYALKAGLPVLGAVSLSRTKLMWEDGILDDPSVGYQPAEYWAMRDTSGADLTPYYTLSTRLAAAALRDLSDQMHELSSRDTELRNLLQGDSAINHRQRSILGRALRNRDAEFQIAHHQANHNVAYATARADLIDLEERGWLVSEVRGKAFVYRAVPNMRELIEEHEDALRRPARPKR